MNTVTAILLSIAALLIVMYIIRKRLIIRRVLQMPVYQKLTLVNDVLRPFGFEYDLGQEIVTSRRDALQRDFGYAALFDQTAIDLNMILDCEPVYFDYDNRTWLIEFWKGQYGITTGAEIGIYHAFGIVLPDQRANAYFHSAENTEMMPLTLQLLKNGCPVFCLHKVHWWLTGFRVGMFSKTSDLSTRVALTFPNREMLEAFTRSLDLLGYEPCTRHLTVTLEFKYSHSNYPNNSPTRRALVQMLNDFLCFLYRFICRPFTNTLNQMVFLYLHLPFIFRWAVSFRNHHHPRP